MARRVTPSQFRSMVRQAQQKQKQAVDKYNRDVRAYNQKLKQAVDSYNREVRAHNARVRANRDRLRRELNKLSAQSSRTRYVEFGVSVDAVQRSYERLESTAVARDFGDQYNEILDLSEKEAANNIGVMNALLDEQSEDTAGSNIEGDANVIASLDAISPDLSGRWRGALFSLNPKNPDAARHFCTSAREVITQILEIKAPDAAVLGYFSERDVTRDGKPTRRAKVRYFLDRKGLGAGALEDFIEQDMDNVVELFRVFNDGTHGSTGRFSFKQLTAIKQRVEDAIQFLSRVIG